MEFPPSFLKRIGKTVSKPFVSAGRFVGKRILLRPLKAVSSFIYKMLKKPAHNVWALLGILSLFGFMFWMLFPFSMTDVSTSERFGKEGMSLGLDLKGGTHLVYQADLTDQEDVDGAMQGAIDIIRDRIDKYGVTEPNIQKQGNDTIVVQLPGIEDIDEAKELIGQTAVLNFWELKASEAGNVVWGGGFPPFYVEEGSGNYIWVTAEATGSDGEWHQLTGSHFNPNTYAKWGGQLGDEPEVVFELKDEGPRLFEEITERNLQRPLGIFLDDELVSSPTVQSKLTDGGVITGLTWDEAEKLSIQLNSGFLPVDLGRWNDDHSEFLAGEPLFEDSVSATLGEEFVERSVLALIIGLALVMLFMILYYRLPGLMASCALAVYIMVLLGIFKWTGITLTLAGIGGIVLSIGMAVDANVLIFERMREELRTGRTLKAAVDAGFDRAWIAILHSNVSTVIICLVLLAFGNSIVESPPVVAFAAALLVGVLTSMFTAMVVTRAFLSFFTGARMAKRRSLFGVTEETA